MEEAIAAVLTQRNLNEAARSVGVTSSTLLCWRKQLELQTAYREAHSAAQGQSIARMQQASRAAVSTLLKVMVDPGAPASAAYVPPTASWITPSRPLRLNT
jgi:transposase-like protein